MKKLSLLVSGLCLLGLLFAQETKQVHPGKAGSPHVETTYKIGDQTVSITYGRPSKKGREVFGKLVPYGEVWRTGADEATILKTSGDLMMGPLHVVAGEYALFTIPGEKEWTLILNKVSKQWGAFKYDKNMDYGRTAMKVTKAASPVEQLTITIEGKGMDRELKIAWDNVVAVAPLMVH